MTHDTQGRTIRLRGLAEFHEREFPQRLASPPRANALNKMASVEIKFKDLSQAETTCWMSGWKHRTEPARC